jgi:F-type H+-transporting ATPase subunit b
VQIDWFTLAAQIVNFAILVFLLQRFLYGPIVKAMDEREAKIASRLEKVEQKRAKAEEEAAEYREQQRELKEQQERVAARADEEVAERRRELLEEMRGEAEEIERRWHEAIKREQKEFLQELRHRAAEQVVDIVRRALADLADADLELQMIDAFIRDVHKMDQQQRRAMSESIEKSGGQVVIRSTYGIPEGRREELVTAVAD